MTIAGPAGIIRALGDGDAVAGIDYIGRGGLDAALERWLDAVAPYERARRPVGDARRAALLVVDVQRFFTDPASHAHLPALLHVLPRIRGLAATFRERGRPVLFTRHALAPGEDAGRMGDWWGDPVVDGRPEAFLEPSLAAVDAGQVLRKSRYDAFAGTDLRRRLAAEGIDTLVLCGVMTHLCCETTARAAFVRGFHVHLVADATASVDEELHLAALRTLAHGVATVRSAARTAAWLRGDGDGAGDGGGGDVAGEAPSPEEPLPGLVDVAVVGAGPAGLAAAVQVARSSRSVVLLEARRAGGLLRQARRVENHLGAGWLSGSALVRRMLRQAARHGVRPMAATVDRVTATPGAPFVLRTEAGRRLSARAVVLATGTRPRGLGVPGEGEARGHQLLHGVRELLEGWPHDRPGRAVVVGGGDAALDQALTLHDRGWRPEIWIRGRRPRALPRLRSDVHAAAIAVRQRTEVEAVRVVEDALAVRWRSADERGTLRADRLLIAVGRDAVLPTVEVAPAGGGGGAPAREAEALDEVPGLYLAGDVRRGRHRQTAIATGDGIDAAMRAVAHLDREERA